jgi:hypothetical protein
MVISIAERDRQRAREVQNARISQNIICSSAKGRFLGFYMCGRDGEVRFGSIATKIDYSDEFRLSPKSGSTADIAVGPVRARSGHSRAAAGGHSGATERSAGEPGIHPSAGRAPRHKTAPVCARRPPATSGRAEASSTRPRRHRTTIGESDVRPACGPSTRGRDPSQPCFTIGHALSLRGRAASSAGTVASSLR